MPKQPVILTLGHRQYLFPDDTGVASILKAFSRSSECFHYTSSKKVLIQESPEVSMAYVPAKTKYVIETDGEETPVVPFAAKQISKTGQLRLK